MFTLYGIPLTALIVPFIIAFLSLLMFGVGWVITGGLIVRYTGSVFLGFFQGIIGGVLTHYITVVILSFVVEMVFPGSLYYMQQN